MPTRLNSADQFTLMMDHEIRQSGLAGNYCAIALKLQGSPDPSALAARCESFAKRFPRSTARLISLGRRYAWQLVPGTRLPFELHDLRGTEPPAEQARLERIINRQFDPAESPPIEIHLLQQDNDAWLVMRWFHPVCDAKGAELVIHHLFQSHTSEPMDADSPLQELSWGFGLWKKIRLGLSAKRRMDKLDRLPSILPPYDKGGDQDNQPGGEIALHIAQFDTRHSTEILGNARRATGMTGTALYFIGCMMRALAQMGGTADGEAFLVPYAVNFRRNRSVSPVFGNQVSFLFLQAERSVVDSRKDLFAQLKEQNRDAIKNRRELAMVPLMEAGSWLPLPKYGGIVRKSPAGRERNSFWFSYTGGMEPEQKEILGCPIVDMSQMTQVTAPPGLGLLVNNFQGRLVLSFNYLSDRFSRDWIESLASRMQAELLYGEPRS